MSGGAFFVGDYVVLQIRVRIMHPGFVCRAGRRTAGGRADQARNSAKGGSGRCGSQASRLKASDNDLELEGLNGRATSRLIMEEIVDGSAFAALRDYLSHKPKS